MEIYLLFCLIIQVENHNIFFKIFCRGFVRLRLTALASKISINLICKESIGVEIIFNSVKNGQIFDNNCFQSCLPCTEMRSFGRLSIILHDIYIISPNDNHIKKYI